MALLIIAVFCLRLISQWNYYYLFSLKSILSKCVLLSVLVQIFNLFSDIVSYEPTIHTRQNNRIIQYCNSVYLSEFVPGKNHICICIFFVLFIIVNTTDSSWIVILSNLVVSRNLPKFVNLYNLSQNVILSIIVWPQNHPKMINIIKSSRIIIFCQIIPNRHLIYPCLIFNIIQNCV